jgi:hypothetical protein
VTLIQVLVLLAQNLPAILKMLEEMSKAADKKALDKKVSDDIETITNAFKTGDADALRKLFNS